MFREDSLLSGFRGHEHGDRIRRFRDLDVQVTDSVRELVQGRLAEKVPRGPAALSTTPNSEMGVLHRELGKKARHMPIRKLFERIPNVIARLEPCLLMSPLSVAQYLGPDFPRFDRVVFDEAAQIPGWDAVGAVARGRSVVVVGDSRQLPPTNFFARSDEEDYEEGEVEELESILEECVAARLPRWRLGWHYRSQHESLIAFSNIHYYENRLLTFPSPHQGASPAEGLGVQWRPVPGGVYDKGRSRTNRAEAEAIVDEVVLRLTDPGRAGRSIGVVTFSLPQQALIEDLLDEARRRRPEIEPYFGDAVPEAVFVKNLENGQGDERDVILFSVCYARDAQGRVAMNFGPLNREGGERRLNVAVTRARREVVVFGTLLPEEIDLSRTRAQGVRDLKSFLEYARGGPAALAQALNPVADGAAGTEFEAAVARALSARGWEVVPRVGCSEYRVDLAVKDIDRPGRFLLGIECDGPTYHSARTARDRDRLRAAVLQKLGWRLHRVWSTDWWQAPEAELEKGVAAIEEARRIRDLPPPEGPPLPGAAVPVPPRPVAERAAGESRIGTPYRAARLGELGTPDAFHDPAASELLRIAISEVLETESPVALSILIRRVAGAWGFSRVTPRLRQRIEEHLPLDLVRTPGEDESFLWSGGQDPSGFDRVRVDCERSVEEIPPEELAAAARVILEFHVSLPRSDLAREVARIFGIQRLGNNVSRCVERGIELLVGSGAASVSGDLVRHVH